MEINPGGASREPGLAFSDAAATAPSGPRRPAHSSAATQATLSPTRAIARREERSLRSSPRPGAVPLLFDFAPDQNLGPQWERPDLSDILAELG